MWQTRREAGQLCGGRWNKNITAWEPGSIAKRRTAVYTSLFRCEQGDQCWWTVQQPQSLHCHLVSDPWICRSSDCSQDLHAQNAQSSNSNARVSGPKVRLATKCLSKHVLVLRFQRTAFVQLVLLLHDKPLGGEAFVAFVKLY